MPLSTQPQNILVIRGGAVGDFILTTPVLLSLRAAYPNTTLTVAGHPNRIALVADLIDTALDIDAAEWAPLFSDHPDPGPLAERLAETDLIISYMPDPDGTFAANLRKACTGRVITHDPHPPDDGSLHIIDHLLDALRPLEIATTTVPRIHPPTMATEIASPYLVIHPGSGGLQKVWPSDRFARVAETFATSYRIIITSGPADRGVAGELGQHIPGARVLDAVPLTELAAVLSGASLYVGNDTGPSHLAAAVGTPTVAIFGPTDPRIWGPRGERVAVVTADASIAPSDRLFAVTEDQVIRASKHLISLKI